MSLDSLFSTLYRLKFDNSYTGEIFLVQAETGRTISVQVLDQHNKIVDVSDLSLDFLIGSSTAAYKTKGTHGDPTMGEFNIPIPSTMVPEAGHFKGQFFLSNSAGHRVGSKLVDVRIEPNIENGELVGKNVLIDFGKVYRAIELLEMHAQTVEEARDLDASLMSRIATGDATEADLLAASQNAAAQNGALQSTIEASGQTITSLGNAKAQAEQATTTLTSATSAGDLARTSLENATDKGDQVIQALAGVDQAAQTLAEVDQAAQATETIILGLMDQLDLTKGEVEAIIAQGDLSQYLTTQDLAAYDLDGLRASVTSLTQAMPTKADQATTQTALDGKADLGADGKVLSTQLPPDPVFYADGIAMTADDPTAVAEEIAALKEGSELTVVSSDPDADGIYRTVTWTRRDGTTYAKSTLSGDDPYNRLEIAYYDKTGTGVDKTIAWALTIDANGFVSRKELTA